VGFIIIQQQPKDSSISKIGQTASFHVEASGIAAYQWYYSKDGGQNWYKSTATGADTDTLSVKVSSTNKNNLYRCKVRDLEGHEGWTEAGGFGKGAVITEQPVDARGVMGYPVYFTIKAEDVASYQWQYSKDGGKSWYKSTAEGATTDTLTIKVAESNKNNHYRCRITAADDSVIFSDPVAIHVHELYYGYEYDPNNDYRTEQHYIYCKTCILRRDYTDHIWNEPSEGAICTVCGAYMHPDMYENPAEEVVVPLKSDDANRIGTERCTHEDAAFHSGPSGWSINCFQCGYSASGK
ncbi:MAG: hypothetical protein MJ117_12105, partial [Lachnospiraceae bacterium]|nr:hypothetical protein [Lachnospiraceae bacterium]